MASPFVYDDPVSGSDLVGRQADLARLTEFALDGRNCRIEAPRRFGKTSLLRAVGEAVGLEGAVFVEVNFLGCLTEADVAARIERAYAAQLDSRLRRWFDGIRRSLTPTLKAAPGGVGVEATIRSGSGGTALLDRLALPSRVHERTGRVTVIAYDEFQEVMRIDAGLAGTFRSEIERHGRKAGYLYSGSHPGLMREMFASRQNAFFGQATPVSLGPLPAVDLADFVAERFAGRGRTASDEALDALLDASQGHPQRAMLLAHHLFERTPARGTADIETWTAAFDAARLETAGEIELLWDTSSGVERGIMKAVAHGDTSLTSNAARLRFGVAKGTGTSTAVRRLEGDGHVVADAATRSGWRLVDPFLARWLVDAS